MSDKRNYTVSSLEAMTVKELVKHVLDEFNVEIDPDAMSKQKIVGYILALQDLRESGVAVETVVDTDAGDDVVKTPEALAAEQAAKEIEVSEVIRQSEERRVRVTFNSSNEPGGNMPIKMGLNGRAYVVHRDVEVQIPESVFNACIRDAIQTIYEPEVDPVTRITTISKERQASRFSYTVHGYTDGRQAA